MRATFPIFEPNCVKRCFTLKLGDDNMTEENYNYRTNPLFLRNQFADENPYGIPTIPKASLTDESCANLQLLGYDRINCDDGHMYDRMVHFFLYDYKFEKIWTKPDVDIHKLKNYRGVFTPDFSMYLEMPTALQLYNTFRNRWCGAYFASQGLCVIPTVNWADSDSFDFCFQGIPRGSTVAVSTYMASAHNHHADQKEYFMNGYNEMLRQIEPERIICYHEPFPEMEGNIVYVNYELSSWKYQKNEQPLSPYVDCILGKSPIPKNSTLVVKSGHIIHENLRKKGAGSAYGGTWVPKSDDDKLLHGEPGQKKSSGYKVTTIGKDGRATEQQHNTDHGNGKMHSDPHTHEISWSPNGTPIFGPAQNNFSAKSFNLHHMEVKSMKWTPEYLYSIATPEKLAENRFETIRDFKWCMRSGGEVSFHYNNRLYGIFANIPNAETGELGIVITEIGDTKNDQEMVWYATAEKALNHNVQNVTLRAILKEIDVFDRTV